MDLTLYDRATGMPAKMVGGYDEFSRARIPTTLAVLHASAGIAICSATPWRQRASRSTRLSGGILTIATGRSTRFSISDMKLSLRRELVTIV